MNRILLGASFAALVAAFGAGSFGCGSSVSSVCDEACDCSGCSDNEYDDCVDDAEDVEREAEKAGCEDQFDDYLACVDDQLECREGQLDADGCESEAKSLAECGDGVSVGFGGNACARLYTHLTGCGIAVNEQLTTVACPSVVFPCVNCLNDLNCTELGDVAKVQACADLCNSIGGGSGTGPAPPGG